MSDKLVELLGTWFTLRGVGSSSGERAAYLGTDPATYSRIANGRTKLTRRRADDWSARLCEEPAAAAKLAKDLLAASLEDDDAPKVTIGQFFDGIVAEGGAVPVERIAILFQALAAPGIEDPAVLVEYRDTARAGPMAKYQDLGRVLGDAIARGVSFGMFMPFSAQAAGAEEDEQRPEINEQQQQQQQQFAAEDNDPWVAVATRGYMDEVRESCRAAYRAFRRQAEQARRQGVRPAPDKPIRDIDKLLKLYEQSRPGASNGFQAKMFYIQFDTRDGEIAIRHQRILQWVSTPKRDLLIYRGEMIKPEAVRDSFFPVPHFFDARKLLPELPSSEVVEEVLSLMPNNRRAGTATTWVTYADS